MKEKNLIILITAVILVALLLFIGFGLTTNNDNNTTNDTINLTLNDTNNTNNTTENQTQTQTQKKTTSSTKKSEEPSVVSESVDYNYQVDDGSYIRTVEYSDGNFKQYDMSGNEISPGDMT